MHGKPCPSWPLPTFLCSSYLSHTTLGAQDMMRCSGCSSKCDASTHLFSSQKTTRCSVSIIVLSFFPHIRQSCFLAQTLNLHTVLCFESARQLAMQNLSFLPHPDKSIHLPVTFSGNLTSSCSLERCFLITWRSFANLR